MSEFRDNNSQDHQRPIPGAQMLGKGDDARKIAYHIVPSNENGSGRPGVVWLGGFKSDMSGAKALALEYFCRQSGRACLRFDYSGHGESSGAFTDGTISRWLEESLAMFREKTSGPQILVGSSMGGWLALLVARALAANERERIAGLVLIAPAVDFTERLMWETFPAAVKAEIETKGVWLRPSDYAPEPTPITRALIEDGRKHLLFNGEIRTHAPVHILQGMKDPDVPWKHAAALVEHLDRDPAILTLVRDGDHRLSRDEDIARLIDAVETIA